MSNAVTVTVTWDIKPELSDTFVKALERMFPVTRTREGFRSIRLLKSAGEPNQFLLVEEWDEVRNFQDYVQFRTDTGDAAELLAMTVGAPGIGVWALDSLADAKA